MLNKWSKLVNGGSDRLFFSGKIKLMIKTDFLFPKNMEKLNL